MQFKEFIKSLPDGAYQLGLSDSIDLPETHAVAWIKVGEHDQFYFDPNLGIFHCSSSDEFIKILMFNSEYNSVSFNPFVLKN